MPGAVLGCIIGWFIIKPVNHVLGAFSAPSIAFSIA